MKIPFVPFVLVLAISPVLAAQSPNPPPFGTPYVHVRGWNRVSTNCNGLEDMSLSRYYLLGQGFTIPLAECTQTINIVVSRNGGTEDPDIGRITLFGGFSSESGELNIVFVQAEPQFGPISPPGNDTPIPTKVGRDWGGIDTTDVVPRVNFYGAINRNLVGSINLTASNNTTRPKRLQRFDVGGQLQSSITIGAPGLFGGLCAIEAGSSTSNGSITLQTGDLTRVKFTSLGGTAAGAIRANAGNIASVSAVSGFGNLNCDISAPNGTIAEIDGNAGAVSYGPASGAGPTINAAFINRVFVNSFRGTLTATGNATTTAQSLQRFQTADGFFGALTVRRVERPNGATWTNAMNVAGQTNGAVNLNGAVLSPVNLAGGLPSGSLSFGTLNSTLAVPGALGGPITGAIIASGALLSLGSVPSTQSITLSGDLAGSLTTSGAMSGRVNIGGSLSGDITVPNNGLVGQIILNQQGVLSPVPAGNGWSGVINVGPQSLTPASGSTRPEYQMNSLIFGGGAVGGAPFRLYGQDCMPNNNQSTPGSITNSMLFESASIMMSMYGPVQRSDNPTATDALPALFIEKKNQMTGAFDIDASSAFTATFQNAGSRRRILIDTTANSAALVQLGDFRVRPLLVGATKLVCSGVNGNPIVDTANPLGFEYFFRVTTNCYNRPADFNNDLVVDPDDLSDYITCYFSTPPCPEADINDDSFIDPDDLSDYITIFFQHPCG